MNHAEPLGEEKRPGPTYGGQPAALSPGAELTTDNTARDDFNVIPDERLGRSLSQGAEHVAEHRTHGG